MRKLFIALCCTVALSGCSVTPELRIKSADLTMTIQQNVPRIGKVAFSPDRRFALSGNAFQCAALWDLSTASLVKTFGEPQSRFKYPIPLLVDFSPDSQYALTLKEGEKIDVWSIASGVRERVLGDKGPLGFVWSPDRQQLLTAEWRFSPPKSLLGDPGSHFFTTVWDWKSGNSMRGFPINGHESVFGGAVAPVAISADGQYILTGGDDGTVALSDFRTGQLVKSTKAAKSKRPIAAVDFSPDGKRAAADDFNGGIRIWDVPSFSSVHHIENAHSCAISDTIKISNVMFSPDGKFVLSLGLCDGIIKIWDVETGALSRSVEAHSCNYMIVGAHGLEFSKDGKYLISGGDSSTRIWDYATGEEIATLLRFEDGEWLVMTPNGYYNASEKGDQYLNVTVGGQPYSIAQLRESFYRPDLVKVALSGGSLKEFRRIAEIKQPPTVAIVDTPASIGTLETTVTVKVTDAGGGIGDVRLYLNGSAVVLDSSRGITLTPTAGTGAVVKRYTVKLAQGTNSIRAIAFNADNSMQSSDATCQIVSTYKAPTRPSLHALVIGVNQYKNPKLQLNYAVADAQLFADTLQQAATPLFEQVKVTCLLTREETTQENILQTLRSYRELNPDDLFVFYVASHGTVDDGEYFLLSSNVGSTSTAKLKTDAISQHALKEIVANIPATKKLIVIDTCSAGHLGDAIQTAMLTRGMSEDTAIKVLSRAVGSTILSASTSVQEALEGYQGHGLFTYVLTDGLKGKADKGRTGFVKTTELADYVDNEVPLLAERIFNRAQYPTISISGQAFPIGRVQ